MDFSIGNVIIIIALIIAGGVMIWQFVSANNPDTKLEDKTWIDDVENTEDSLEETEEFLRRMERLSKRTNDKDDDKKK